MTGGREQDLMDMSVEELKAYKEKIIEKIETHLPELCGDIDEVIALKKNLNNHYPKSKVKIINTKVTKNNINKLIVGNDLNNEIDFFSLDIDSNDYWILNSMDLSKINVLCCEYNHWLGKDQKLTIYTIDELRKYFTLNVKELYWI